MAQISQDIKQIIPDYSCYYNYKSGNYGSHALRFQVNGKQFYFSYSTLVAFNSQKTGLVCIENLWQQTTGKHLNAIQPDHKKRVDLRTFEALLLLALQQ